jgi:hypothetical protein
MFQLSDYDLLIKEIADDLCRKKVLNNLFCRVVAEKLVKTVLKTINKRGYTLCLK